MKKKTSRKTLCVVLVVINKLCNTLDTNLIGDIVEVDVDDVVDGDRAGA